MQQGIIPIPADPSREDLRGAQTVLKGLAAVKITGAAEQLKAVEMLIRHKYPRVVDKSKPRRTRRAKRSKLIEGRDARCPCRRCNGRGTLDSGRLWHKDSTEGRQDLDASLALAGIDPIAWRAALKADPPKVVTPTQTCPRCEGSGVQDGIAEHDPADTHCSAGLARGEKPIRGEFAQQYGVSGYHPMSPNAHTRGFVNGVVVHCMSPDAIEIIQDWSGRRRGADMVDLSAVLEANAIDAVHDDDDAIKPRGRRLNGSRREKTGLTPNQERRSKMARRTAEAQAVHDRLVRRATHARQGPGEAELNASLRLIGIDPKAWRKALKATPTEVSQDSPGVAQARRRGDLPPDDLIDWAEDHAITLGDGRQVVVEGRVKCATLVYRSSTRQIVSITGGVRVREKDGTLDVLHPEDLPTSVA